MLKISKYVTPSPDQWDMAIEGMRNPMNSWDQSDSGCNPIFEQCYEIGQNDYTLMAKLVKAGPDHRKFMRMLPVYITLTAPLYWWKEYETYKVGTVTNSCSTMHKIHAKPFTMDDFSHEFLISGAKFQLHRTVDLLNELREAYLESNSDGVKKSYWYNLIQSLPSSYNQQRTLFLNYEVLSNIYHARKNHKLDEWRKFCDFIKSLPYSELITGEIQP
jgi:hypothetical protein